MQSVFQDPYSSLDPSHTVQDIICEPMEIHKLYTPKERKERAKELIRVVGLKEQDLLKYPHEFSGGQRQRISIARAFLKNAPIILLDEATASLDVENETAIQTALSRLIKDKTVLIIAHRMRTVSGADKIVVLKDGHVAEQGAPEALYKQNGIFTRMLDLQTQSQNWKLEA